MEKSLIAFTFSSTSGEIIEILLISFPSFPNAVFLDGVTVVRPVLMIVTVAEGRHFYALLVPQTSSL